MKTEDLLIVILVALLVVFFAYKLFNNCACPREGFADKCTQQCINPDTGPCYAKNSNCYQTLHHISALYSSSLFITFINISHLAL